MAEPIPPPLPPEVVDFVNRYATHMQQLASSVAGDGTAMAPVSYTSFDGRKRSDISNYPLTQAPYDGFLGANQGRYGAPKTEELEEAIKAGAAQIGRDGQLIGKWLAQVSYLQSYRKALAARRATPLTYRRAWQAHLTYYDAIATAMQEMLAQQPVGVGNQSIPEVREARA